MKFKTEKKINKIMKRLYKRLYRKDKNAEIKILDGGVMPEYKTSGSACADCYARLSETISVKPGQTSKIPLGFAVDLPAGYEAQIRPRSGLSLKGILMPIGTIDSDYHGEVCAIVTNLNKDIPFEISDGDRICQIGLQKVYSFSNVKTQNNERGTGGFGSTGIK